MVIPTAPNLRPAGPPSFRSTQATKQLCVHVHGKREEPRNVRDQRRSRDGVQPEEEGPFVPFLDHALRRQLTGEDEKADEKQKVEPLVRAFVKRHNAVIVAVESKYSEGPNDTLPIPES